MEPSKKPALVLFVVVTTILLLFLAGSFVYVLKSQQRSSAPRQSRALPAPTQLPATASASSNGNASGIIAAPETTPASGREAQLKADTMHVNALSGGAR